MSETLGLSFVAIFVMFMVFIALETCQEKFKCIFGHQASYILVIGMIISLILKVTEHHEDNSLLKLLEFDHNLFFYVCLPPIVFASGFNMHRGDFFANLKIVMVFGVIGTMVSFTMFSFMTVKLNQWIPMEVYDGKFGEWSELQMSSTEIILMSSLLCSSDVIAAVSLISYDKEPRLFSIVFGEGITNDAVSIILFNTVLKYTSKHAEITFWSPFQIGGGFIALGFISVMIGAVFGFASALFMKHFRSFTHNAINQAVILLCFAYVAYIMSELFHESGIISLLVCGIIQAHYTYYNLSSLGQHASYVIFSFISFFMEAFVFIYLGVSFFSFGHLKWCPKLIIVEIFVIMVGRFIAVLGLLAFLRLCTYNSQLNVRQQIFVWFAGMIRGAIAFGLVLKIDETKFANRDIIVTTTLVLVIFTTVVFGSILGLLQFCLFGKEKEQEDEAANMADSFTKALVQESKAEHTEGTMLHPNQSVHEEAKAEVGCGSFSNFDRKYIKPLFVFEYTEEKQKKIDEFDKNILRQKKAEEEIFATLGKSLKDSFRPARKTMDDAETAKKLFAINE